MSNQHSEQVLRLFGQVKHYAWGGADFIPSLFRLERGGQQHFAEYWMGAHPLASSIVSLQGNKFPLAELIAEDPGTFIGKKTASAFGGLPFLFKVLDVRKMLSVQVHPSRKGAEEGFDREESEGIPLHSARRNYRDRNHKPELMMALSDFWLIHGFRPEEELKDLLSVTPAFRSLWPVFTIEGITGLYREVMEMPQERVNEILLPLIGYELEHHPEKQEPGFWVRRLHPNGSGSHADRGIFSLYFLNLLKLSPGDAIYQPPGVLHAYLEGQNLEVMANSDNVLRGGLTNKHVNVPELLKHISFDHMTPRVIHPQLTATGKEYICPAREFRLASVQLDAGAVHIFHSEGPAIMLIIDGNILINRHERPAGRGDVFYMLPGKKPELKALSQALAYYVFVPD